MRNEKGFTLVQVMVVSGLIGGLALVFTQLMKNVQTGQRFAKTNADLLELRTSIRLILNNENYCRVSLAKKKSNGTAVEYPAGTPLSPTSFDKEDVDFGGLDVRDNSFGQSDEGIDIELWQSDLNVEERTRKKFNGSDNIVGDDKSKFGRLKIKSLKLVINNGLGNYPDDSSFVDDSAQIVALIDKGKGRIVKEVFDNA